MFCTLLQGRRLDFLTRGDQAVSGGGGGGRGCLFESESETKKISNVKKMIQKHIQAKASMDKLCETKQNQRYSPIKKKQHNLIIRFEPLALLEFSPPLESCSDIYGGPTSCLILTLLFNILFLRYFPLFYLPSLSLYL